MDTLSLLFGSPLRVKLMRLFLFNPDTAFDVQYIEGKTGARGKDIEKEMLFFKKLGIVKTNKASKTVLEKKGKKVIEKTKKVPVYSLDKHFEFTEPLTEFLVRTHSLEHKTIVKRIGKTGRIKTVIISGIFLRNDESRLDLFVIGDGVKQSALERVVKTIESDMGKDIRYVLLSAEDFAYRVGMNDKLIRDVLDYPHTILVDRIGVSEA